MPTWKSRGLRGSALEDMINYTIEQYSTKKLALIQKIPTPIKPINIDQETRHITLAYFDQKVQSIILVQFRAFQSALMQRNRQSIPFHCRIFMSIR